MRGVVVLNANFEYWDEVSVRRAVVKLIKGKAITIAHNGKLLGVVEGQEIWYPYIIQLTTGFVGYKCKSTRANYSDGAVFDRDNNYCQYWHYHKFDNEGRPFTVPPYQYRCTEDDRTVDHIVPVSRGGKNTFENVVCACRYCNEIIKKNKTPAEAGMKLLRMPTLPRKVIGEMVQRKFIFNPKKPSHQEYIKLRYNGEWK